MFIMSFAKCVRLVAPGGGHARDLLELFLGQLVPGDHFPFRPRQRHDVVVEAGNGNGLVGVVQLRQDLGERLCGVCGSRL
jgi:hypothetical protein